MKVSMLSTGVAWTTGWPEDVEGEAILSAMLIGTTIQTLLKPFRLRQLIHGVWAFALGPKPTPLGRKEILACVAIPSTFASTSLSPFIPGSISGIQCKVA